MQTHIYSFKRRTTIFYLINKTFFNEKLDEVNVKITQIYICFSYQCEKQNK